MGSDLAPFFANFFLYYYEKNWIKDTRNFQHSSCQNENISFVIYLYSYKVKISFLTMVHHRFWRNNYQTLLSQLKFKEWKSIRLSIFSYENYIIRILSLEFCSLKMCLHFLTQRCVFSCKKRLIFT